MTHIVRFSLFVACLASASHAFAALEMPRLVEPYPSDNNMRAIVFEPSRPQFTAVGLGGSVAHSVDGTLWRGLRVSTDAQDVTGVADSGSMLVMTGPTFGMMRSTDGETWTVSSAPSGFRAVIWDGTRFVAAGNSGLIAVSTNAVDWVRVGPWANSSISHYFTSIGHNNGTYLFVGNLGNLTHSACYRTTDLFNAGSYSDRDSKVTAEIRSIAFYNGTWAAVTAEAQAIYSNNDGSEWFLAEKVFDFSEAVALHGITSDERGFITCGSNGRVATSTDGVNWVDRSILSNDPLLPVRDLYCVAAGRAFGTNHVVISGQRGEIFSSIDNIDWIRRGRRAIYDELHRVEFVNNQHLAVGRNGMLLASPDGFSWSRRPFPENDRRLTDVAFGAGRYVAVGESKVLYHSTNLVDWTKATEPPAFNESLYAVDYGGGRFRATGSAGVVLDSVDGITWSRTTVGNFSAEDILYASDGTTETWLLGATSSGQNNLYIHNNGSWITAEAATTSPRRGIALRPFQTDGAFPGLPRFILSGSVDISRNSSFPPLNGWAASSVLLETFDSTWGDDEFVISGRNILYTTTDGSVISPLVLPIGLYRSTAHGQSTYTLCNQNFNGFPSIFAAGDGSIRRPQLVLETNFIGFVNHPLRADLNVTPLNAVLTAPTLPAGLNWRPTPPAIFGMPTAPGEFQIEIAANDPGDPAGTSTTLRVGLSILNPNPPVLTVADYIPIVVGSPVTVPVLATFAPQEFSVDRLPPGLGLDTRSGEISGTPLEVGTTRSTIRARNFFGETTKTIIFQSTYPQRPFSWVWRNPLPTGQDLFGACFGAGRYVVAGGTDGRGFILTSEDLVDWSARGIGATDRLTDVSFSDGVFLTSSEDGFVFTSTDGISWNRMTLESALPLLTCVHHNGTYLAAGVLGVAFASTDAKRWYSVDLGTDRAVNRIRYLNGRYIAVGDAGSINVSLDGREWNSFSSPLSQSLVNVEFDEARQLYVILSSQRGIITSPDAQVWTARGTVANSTIGTAALVYGTNLLVAAGGDGNIFTTEDPLNNANISWTARTPLTPHFINAGAFGSSGFLLAGDHGILLSSVDGANWVLRNQYNAGDQEIRRIRPVTDDLVITVGDSGLLATSTNGAYWTIRDQPTTGITLRSAASSGSQHVVVGDAGTILSSRNQVEWLKQVSGVSQALRGVAYSSNLNLFAAVGAVNTILTSPDGEIWEQQFNRPETGDLNDIVWAGDRFVACGRQFLTSLNGISWTNASSGVDVSITGIDWDNGRFVASGGFLTFDSLDGLSWNNHTFPPLNNYADIAIGNGWAIAAGSDGANGPPLVCVSSNFVDWDFRIFDAHPGTRGQSAAHFKNTFLWGGRFGDLLQTTDGTSPPPLFDGNARAFGYVNRPFYFQVSAFHNPTNFSSQAPLPPGLSLDGFTGEISGTPTTEGNYAFPLTATSRSGASTTTIFIDIGRAEPPILLPPFELNAEVGQPFSFTMVGTNIPTSFDAPGLPADFVVDRATGEISGRIRAAGTFAFNGFAFNQFGSDAKPYTITSVLPPPPVITSPLEAQAYRNFEFNYQIGASRFPTGFDAMNLPTGLSVNRNTGTIAGRPTTLGIFVSQIIATNAGGMGTANLTIRVDDPLPPEIVSATNVLGAIGSPFRYQIIATREPFAFSADDLALAPLGLTFIPEQARIDGVPNVEGLFPIEIGARNQFGETRVTMTIRIGSEPLLGDNVADLVQQKGKSLRLALIDNLAISKTLDITPLQKKGVVMASRDFNNDSSTDLVIRRGSLYSLQTLEFVSLLREFPMITNKTEAKPFGKVVGSGDVDGDSFADVIFQRKNVYSWLPWQAVRRPDNASIRPLFTNSARGTLSAVGDFNGDGFADVVVQKGKTIDVILLNLNQLNPAAEFSSKINLSTTEKTKVVAAADVDGNGTYDLVRARGKVISAWVMTNSTTSVTIVSDAQLTGANRKFRTVGPK